MKWYDKIAYALISIGAINWGLAVFDFNLIPTIFATFLVYDQVVILSKVVYALVGLSGIYAIWLLLSKQLK